MRRTTTGCGPARRYSAASTRSAAPSTAAASSASTARSWRAPSSPRGGAARRRRAFAEIDQLDALARSGEGDTALLEVERVAAEELEAPAGQRAHLGAVIGGDHLEVVGIGDQLLRHAALLAAVFEQHAQEVDERTDAGRRLVAGGGLGIVALRQRQGAADRGENLGARPAPHQPPSQAAPARQFRDGAPRAGGGL